jgi:antirestriction protein ArdC
MARTFPGPSAEEKITASIIALMEKGVSPWRKPWVSGASCHVNLVSGHRYRGANPLLLQIGQLAREAELPFWCGVGEARRFGLFPRKGSKAAYVYRPAPRTKEVLWPDGSVSTDRWISYRAVPVFNAADLEGESIAALIQARQRSEAGRERPSFERVSQAGARLSQWPVQVLSGGDRACYSPALDRIRLPQPESFASVEGYCAVWAHEAAHSTGHPSRLGRDLSGGFGSTVYAREELVAELAASLICQRLQIGTDVASHAAYLASWIGILGESPKALLSVLGEARKAADLIAPEEELLEAKPLAVPA